MNNITKKYQDLIGNNPQEYQKDLADITRKLNNSNARYKGKIIDFLYQPVFFEQDDIAKFNYILQMMMDIIRKCTKEYLQNPQFRTHFGFSREMEELILIDPGYCNPVPIARFDIFYDGDFKFCELNGDGTSAMNEANTLEQIFSESKIITKLREEYDINHYELFKSWLTQLLNIYHEFGGIGKPNIAIADFIGIGSNEEFDTFKQVFENAGYRTIICDPRDMVYKNGKLYSNNVQIDLIYRRAVNQEVEKRLQEMQDFITAYREKAVCVVGPFRSQIMHNKIFFSILTDESKTNFLNVEERKFIIEHIPKTYVLNEDFSSKANKFKDKFLIKPMDKYAGKGVCCGVDISQQKWKSTLANALKEGDHLLQEFCNFTKMKIPVMYEDKFNLKEFKTTLGLFVYNGKLAGLYSRCGSKNVIAGIEESITLPSFVVSKRS